MNGKTIYATKLPDGTLVEELSDGTIRPFPPQPPSPPMTEEEFLEAACSDPDTRPKTREERKNTRRVPRIKTLRRAMRLEAEEFAALYHIPLDVINDWEQYRSEPDPVASAYLKVIAAIPETVKQVFLELESSVQHERSQLENDEQQNPAPPSVQSGDPQSTILAH